MLQGVLGKGSFGKVVQAQKKDSGEVVAIKIIPIGMLKKNDLITQIVNEVKIMSQLGACKQIIKLVDFFEDENNLYLVLELAGQGTLMEMLNKFGRLKERTAAKIMRDVILAIEFLHSKNIIHRDLKPDNVLIDNNGLAKLSDFGWSSKLAGDEDRRRTFCGTPDYIPPEMIDGKDYDVSIDIWCCGVMLYEMLNGTPPFTPLGDADTFANSGTKLKKIYENIKKMKFMENENKIPLSKEVQSLLKSMMNRVPKDRIKIAQIKTHPWFAMVKISFDIDPSRPSQQNSSGLISDSMILEADDPFDDFMNKRFDPNATSSAASSFNDQSKISEEETSGTILETESKFSQGMAKKKLGIESFNETYDLETIPEEKRSVPQGLGGSRSSEDDLTIEKTQSPREGRKAKDTFLELMNNQQGSKAAENTIKELQNELENSRLSSELFEIRLKEKSDLLDIQNKKTSRLEEQNKELNQQIKELSDEKAKQEADLKAKDQIIAELTQKLQNMTTN